jgi:hypothetical protein
MEKKVRKFYLNTYKQFEQNRTVTSMVFLFGYLVFTVFYFM